MHSRSRQQALDHLAVDVGQAEIASLEAVGELGVVETQQVHERSVQVVDVDLVLDHPEAQVVEDLAEDLAGSRGQDLGV